MKLQFVLSATRATMGDKKDYAYIFRFIGETNDGGHYESDWFGMDISASSAKEAKKEIEQIMIDRGAFDWALDGLCPYLNGAI